MKQIALFASGSGSNAVNIVEQFASAQGLRVSLLICNNPNAPVINKMKVRGVPVFLFTNSEIQEGSTLTDLLANNRIDLIVLAGFMRKIPNVLTARFKDRILNIHPSLLPEFGGKGMYGEHVFRAVIRSGTKESGITVHLVDEEYDRGKILFQASLEIKPDETIESLAARTHELEHLHYPRVIRNYSDLIQP